MNFTPRDARLLRWINGHGFVTVKQAATWLNNRYQTCHRRLKRLVDGGFLTTTRVGHSRYAFRLTKAGVVESGDDLPPLKLIAMGTHNHDWQLVNLAMRLEGRLGGRFVTERRIRQDRCSSGVGVHGHVPDGLFLLDDRKSIAIELELSAKGWRRLQGILSGYAADLDIGEVWYFAGSKPLRRRLQRAAVGYPFIKIYDWRSSEQNVIDDEFEDVIPPIAPSRHRSPKTAAGEV